MSHDIRFAVKVADVAHDIYAVIGVPEHDSPTYNVRRIFVQAMDWDYRQGEWYRMDEILPKIERGVHELRFNASAYTHLEPENGWGSTSTALNTLQSILNWFQDDDQGRSIPLKCIYMCW